MEVNSYNLRRLLDTVDAILGRGKVSASAAIDVNLFSQYFADSVAKMRLVADISL